MTHHTKCALCAAAPVSNNGLLCLNCERLRRWIQENPKDERQACISLACDALLKAQLPPDSKTSETCEGCVFFDHRSKDSCLEDPVRDRICPASEICKAFHPSLQLRAVLAAERQAAILEAQQRLVEKSQEMTSAMMERAQKAADTLEADFRSFDKLKD